MVKPYFDFSAKQICFVNGFSAAEKLLRRFPDLVDVTNKDEATALHMAAAAGHVDVADILIKATITTLCLKDWTGKFGDNSIKS